MREITTHKGSELDDALTITVRDEPGHGGACHDYMIEYRYDELSGHYDRIKFQNGPVKERGVNGISIESLLAICIDRLEGFIQGAGTLGVPDYNGWAHYHLQASLKALQARTVDRQARGVEGTSTP